MDDSKIFMFPDGGTSKTSSDVSSLLPLLMCNGGFGGGNWVWIIFLFFLYPLMRNGGLFGNMGQNGGGCLGPLANMVSNNDGRDLLMQAINGNGAATQRLATMFGTKVDMIQAAIANVSNGITQVGCKIDNTFYGAVIIIKVMNIKEGFDVYDELPEDMIAYLRYNGRHFNRRLVEFATSKMTTRDSNGTEVPLEPISKDKLFDMMKQNGVYLDNNDNPYDAVFAANMCKADYLGSSITDEKHLCLYVKDVIDDVDGYDGIVFNRWYADMCRKGVQVDWYDCR